MSLSNISLNFKTCLTLKLESTPSLTSINFLFVFFEKNQDTRVNKETYNSTWGGPTVRFHEERTTKTKSKLNGHHSLHINVQF